MAPIARAVCFSIALTLWHSSVPAQSPIALAQAERTALGEVPGGSLLSRSLEQTAGRLVWWFDVSIPGSQNVRAIVVDALTGAIVSSTLESPVDR
ncbi:MAG TPA: PepSY domain-containing protein [Burkholderiales bacterium]|nr:PepSY domain-containing protein [Burkholderiales bacterium]